MRSIILAGGSGSRLWPLSRDMYPKQLLSLDNDDSLLQQTYKKLLGLMPAEDILTITNIKHAPNIKLQLNNINSSSVVLSEPIGKNTAPAIACALEYFKRLDNLDDVVLIVPSDHLIQDTEKFYETVKNGIELAKQDYIVTLGIKPCYPETGYGYIKTTNKINNGFKVERFVEKPDLETAKKYLSDGNYYWNGGIFIGRISTFLQEIEKYAPNIYKNLNNLDFSKKADLPYCVYEQMPSISIDYAVMEKSDKIALVELLSDWNDLGSWQALYNVKEKDINGNVTSGKVVINNVKNSFVYSQKEIVAVSDLENIILVETEDAIMACKMTESQNVKKLYEILKKSQSNTTQLHKTVFRPWGYYTCMNSGEGYLTKTICVMPKQKLSLQSHNHRSEHWVVLEGRAIVIKDNKEYNIDAGDSIDIPLGVKHSLQNPFDEKLKIIEIQKGNYISEDDIIRYEDCYGRV